jgi:dihydroflavonol-4-reductase
MIAVTGASGHIGGNLIRTLIDHGEKVRVLLHQDQRALQDLDVEIIEGDVLDPESLRHLFQNVDVVFHAAGYISILMNDWPHLESVNVLGTRNVVEACLFCGVQRLVHFSSIHAFVQEPLDEPIDETRPFADSHRFPPYDRSKAAGQREVLKGIQKGLDAVIVNPTGIIGPFDFRVSHTGEVLLALARSRLPALIKGGFDWVDVRDVVDGALSAWKWAPAGSNYLLAGHWVSVSDMAAEVKKITGVSPPRFQSPIWLARLGAPFMTAFARLAKKRPLYTAVSLRALDSNPRISHAKATLELDYHPRPFSDTIRDTLEWFSANGYL